MSWGGQVVATARVHAMNAEWWLDLARKQPPQDAAACAYVAEVEMKMSVLVRDYTDPGRAGLDRDLLGGN